MHSQDWRTGEQLIPWVERAVQAAKIWDLLIELPPSPEHVDAYEAELEFPTQHIDLAQQGPLLLRGHQESGGALFVTLYQGNVVLRRGHIGGNHQEPDGGQLIQGPHIHYPTSVFHNVGSRRARSRAYSWPVPESVLLRDAITLFCSEVNIVGQPQEQSRLPGGS